MSSVSVGLFVYNLVQHKGDDQRLEWAFRRTDENIPEHTRFKVQEKTKTGVEDNEREQRETKSVSQASDIKK